MTSNFVPGQQQIPSPSKWPVLPITFENVQEHDLRPLYIFCELFYDNVTESVMTYYIIHALAIINIHIADLKILYWCWIIK